MTITFRSAGAWGPGKGARLTSAEIDANFFDLDSRISAITNGGEDPISNIEVLNNALVITTQSGSTFGPFALPKAVFRPRGEWTANTAYALYDIVQVTGDGLYLVVTGHTSGSSFDAALLVSGSAAYSKIMDQAVGAPWQGPDAFGTYSDLATYDAEGPGFSFYSADGDGGTTTSYAVIFWKNSATAGDWTMTYWQGDGGSGGSTPTPPTMSGWIPGPYTDGQKIFRYISIETLYLHVAFPGAIAILDVAPTADCTFEVRVMGNAIGSINFTAGNTIGSWASSQEATVYSSVAIEIVAPSTADATAAGLAFTFPTFYNSQPSAG